MSGLPDRQPLRCARILFVGVVLLIMFPPLSATSPAVAMLEVGDTSGPDTPCKIWPVWLDPEMDVGCAWRVFSEDFTEGTYGSMPILQTRLSFRTGSSRLAPRFFLGAGYGWSDGDPYFSRPSFTGGGIAKLRLVPIQAGINFDLLSGKRWRLKGGLLAEMVWSRETLPAPYYSYPGTISRVSGWTNGIGATIGPQLRSVDQRRAVGLELGLTGNSGPNRGDTQREMNLSGLVWRLYFTTRI